MMDRERRGGRRRWENGAIRGNIKEKWVVEVKYHTANKKNLFLQETSAMFLFFLFKESLAYNSYNS